MPTPRPGSPVRGSKTGVPVMALLDLLGRPWALGVVWALRDGGLTFRALQERCGGVSASVLRDRLQELSEAGAIAHDHPHGYVLTDEGRNLSPIYDVLNAWALRWADRVGQTSESDAAPVSGRHASGLPETAGHDSRATH